MNTDQNQTEDMTNAHDDERTEVPTTPEAQAQAPADEVTEPEQPDTFPRAYVEKLRAEAAEARTKAKKADELARELFSLKVAATRRLADPTDLAYSDEAAEDVDTAITTLLAAKPHLASRRPSGTVAQGATSTAPAVDLAAILRANA